MEIIFLVLLLAVYFVLPSRLQKYRDRLDGQGAAIKALKEEYDARILKLEERIEAMKAALKESEDARMRAEEIERRYFEGVNSIMNYDYNTALNAAKGVRE